jgi:DNA-binding CsgD family transcriptional regulator
MAPNNLRFKLLPSPPPLHCSAQKLNQLEADLVSTTRMWAVDEVRAAMAHQLNDPLTALLFCLHELKERGGHPTGTEAASNPAQEMMDKALHEAERICGIMDRMSQAFDASMDAEIAVGRGRDAIDSWMRNNNARGNGQAPAPSPDSNHRMLTPREREVLDLIVGGASNKEGAHRLGITTRTFEVHRAHIMEKVGARNAADLVRMALSRDG